MINSIEVQKNKGLFTTSVLEKLYDDDYYPHDKLLEILALMERFEICYKILGSHNQYIIPALLPPSPIDYTILDNFINDKTSLQYEIQYLFMPSGIIEKLICRLNNYLKENNIWRKGLILNTENSEALIKADINERRLNIYIRGDGRTSLYNVIEHELKVIHSDIKLEDSDFEIHLACNCFECEPSSTPFMFKRRILINFINRGKKYIDCQQSAEQVNIQNILIGYRTNETLKRSLLRDFISAASTLQTRHMLVKDFKENDINIYFQDIFKSYAVKNNYSLNEQSLKGKSESGNNAGELDFTVETLEGEMITFFEGLILKNFDSHNILKHINKIMLKYDSNGLKEKFVGIYSRAENFYKLSNDYLAYIKELNIQGISLSDSKDVSNIYLGSSEMKIFKTIYFRGDTKLIIYHILINLNF